jgi:hypothetical protein
MQCCNAAGARGIYDLWRYSTSASFSGNILILEVNLRFSVENDYLKLVCHEPIEGIVYIEAKYDCTLKFRLPEGTHSATLTKQGASITELMENEGYVSFVMVKGENIKLEYLPMEKKRSYVVGSIEKNHLASIEGFWRGETLVSVSPKGDYYPLYEERIPIKAVIPTVTSTRAIDSI